MHPIAQAKLKPPAACDIYQAARQLPKIRIEL
jgi:hypothetical protein